MRVPLAVAALLVVACADLSLPRIPGYGRQEFTQDDLRHELAQFSSRFAAVVGATSDSISDRTQDRALRKRALLLRLETIPVVRQAAFEDDPQHGFVSVLTLVVTLRYYLTEGEGRAIWGELQPIAAEAARSLEQDVLAIGARFLSTTDLEHVRAEADELARARPIRGTEFRVERLQQTVAAAHQSGEFAFVLQAPLAPFRAIEGVSSGAGAIHEFNATAREFSGIVETLPEELRGQIELLLYDVEDRTTTQQGLAAFQSLSESASRAADATERLPDEMQAALAESQGALAEANRALETARSLIDPLAATAEQVRLAGDSWKALTERDPEEPRGRPFDIREWQATAGDLRLAAAELRGLAVEVRGLVESPGLDQTVERATSVVDLAQTGAEGLVDRAAWRGLQLLVALFVLLAVYRVLGRLLGARAAS